MYTFELYLISFSSSLEHMLNWKFRARKQNKNKIKVSKRDAFDNQQLTAYVQTDINNYDDDDSSPVEGQNQKQTEPLVRIMPSGKEGAA